MSSEFDNAYDVYSYDKYLGTVGLVDGGIFISAPDEKVIQRLLEALRRFCKMMNIPCSTDAEVFAAMPDYFTGTTHLRKVGDIAGIHDAPPLNGG